MEIVIGTSGFSYPHWANGIFYPSGLNQDKWLEFYSQQFNAVELNVTFYKLPTVSMAKSWDKQTPDGFRFVVKGSRFITHVKRLKDVKESLIMLSDNLLPLRKKIGCFLWQLPPGFKKDAKRLADFCYELKRIKILGRVGHVFEFRDESWFQDDTYAVLRDYDCCLCFADSPEKIGKEVLTADFIYLRFHGGSYFYDSNYSKGELVVWVQKVKALEGKIKTVYAFFNNDEHGYAAFNAQSLRMFLLEKIK